MDIHQFVAQSLGRWKSQRSAHHMVFRHFEAVESVIDITPMSTTDSAVLALCKLYGADPETTVSPFQMRWEGTSDWDEKEELKGSTVLVPIPDPQNPRRGQLLRDQGYAETIPAAGHYHFTDDDTFVLISTYDRAAAEEKIWFANPNLRFRVSFIKTSQGSGVVTASFASELRDLSTQ